MIPRDRSAARKREEYRGDPWRNARRTDEACPASPSSPVDVQRSRIVLLVSHGRFEIANRVRVVSYPAPISAGTRSGVLPVTVMPSRLGTGSTLSRIIDTRSPTGTFGTTERIRAAAPDTCAAATEVPRFHP